MMIGSQCKREDCFAWVSERRYKNCCTALDEVIEFECPFYKSKGQIKDEKEKMRKRYWNDLAYRMTCEEYGFKFKKRGRKEDDGRD